MARCGCGCELDEPEAMRLSCLLDGGAAVLSATRLGDALQGIPTVREQGVEIVWPTVRRVYISAKVPKDAVQQWAAAFQEAPASPQYAALQAKHRLSVFVDGGRGWRSLWRSSWLAIGRYGGVGLRRWER